MKCSLSWEQIDFEAGTVRLLPGATKNKGRRLIFLAPELKAVLEQQWSEHHAQYADYPLVFHRHGQRIKDVRDSWERACTEAGLSGRIPRDFRRTAVRNMVRAGISKHIAMKISGHKTRGIFDRYDIVSEGDLKGAAQKLSRWLSAQTMTKTMTIDGAPQQAPTLSH